MFTKIAFNFFRAEKYHGEYFERSAVKNVRICDETGLFQCEGKYIEENCSYNGDMKQVLFHLLKINEKEV